MTGAEVRGEAARLVRRLEAAEQRLAEAHTPPAPSQPRATAASTHEISHADTAIARACAEGAAGGGGNAGDEDPPRLRINEVDDEVRALLAPASNRVAELVELARALADGSLSDESAEESARAIAATQPSRRPR